MTWFITAYLITVLVGPLLAGAVVSLRGMPAGRVCPRCAARTFLLQSRWLRRLARVPGLAFERRWCPCCAWEGAVRIPTPSVRLVLQDRNPPRAPRQRAVRSLAVDGVTWQVRLETWRVDDVWYARFVFVEPGGRRWPDGQPLIGPSVQEVVRRARSLPPGQLVSRVRELVSD